MDKLLACFVAAPLLLAACQTPAGFVEGSKLGIVAQSPAQFPVVFVNSRTGDGLRKFPENEWTAVDVSGIVPPAAKAVYLSGLLIITHGTVPEVCDPTLAYRNYEEGGDYTYVAQTIAAEPNGGQRIPHSIWIPVREGNFEMKWRRSTVGEWPEHCAYGINLNPAVRPWSSRATVTSSPGEIVTDRGILRLDCRRSNSRTPSAGRMAPPAQPAHSA